MPRSQGATPASHKRKLSLAGKGTGPRSVTARTRTGRGSNLGSGSSRRRGAGGSRQGRASSPPGPARGPRPAPRPGGETAAALPGGVAAEVAPLGLASVLRPRRLRSGQGWSGRRSPPARALRLAPTSSSPPPARCSWLPLSPSLPSLSKPPSLPLSRLFPPRRTHTLTSSPPWLSCLSHTLPRCLLLSPAPSFLLSLPLTLSLLSFFLVTLPPLSLAFPPPSRPLPPLPGLGPRFQLCLPWLRGRGLLTVVQRWFLPTAGQPALGGLDPWDQVAPATLGCPALSHPGIKLEERGRTSFRGQVWTILGSGLETTRA